MKSYSFPFAAIVSVMLFALVACQNKVLPPAPVNPPVIIVGGSIHVQDINQAWGNTSDYQWYTAITGDSTQISPGYGVLYNGKPVSNITASSGWKIEIYDPQSRGGKGPGVTLCTVPTCDGKGDGSTVYVQTRPDANTGFQTVNNGKDLIFHSTVQGCDSSFSGSENPHCDHIDKIRFYDCSQSTKCDKSVQWDCDNSTPGNPAQGKCSIGIGHLP